MIRYVHPFPARMAPHIALDKLSGLPNDSRVLDPMSGSGTVVRAAADLGFTATGCDIDPLSLLMTKVATSHLDPKLIVDAGSYLRRAYCDIPRSRTYLPWIDECRETRQFIEFWFAPRQRRELRRLAFGLSEQPAGAMRDALSLALSRTIVTKSYGASLAWDVSHSRPHKAKVSNDYDVNLGFETACQQIAGALFVAGKPEQRPRVIRDDARRLERIASRSIDVIVTSPPYLNAIDYLRGHRLSLVWLGFTIPRLRKIRAANTGAEIGLDETPESKSARQTIAALGEVQKLPPNWQRIASRYAIDLLSTVSSCYRVLRRGGACHFVVGDSTLRGVRIYNSRAVISAAEVSGFELKDREIRRIPNMHRYLPSGRHHGNGLSKRMLTEQVLSFRRP